jgi:hypothetical protein
MNDILQDLVKPLLIKIIEYIDNNEYWYAYGTTIAILLFFILIGYLFSWFINRKKIRKEIDKIQIETKEKKVLLIEKVQSLRKNFVDNSKLLSLSIRLNIDSIISRDIDSLRNNRDELQTLFFNDFINSFTNYMEIYNEIYPDRFLEFIDDEMTPYLETVIMFKDTVNNRNILQQLDIDELVVEPYSFNQITRFIKNNIHFYRFYKRYLISKKIKEITNQRS